MLVILLSVLMLSSHSKRPHLSTLHPSNVLSQLNEFASAQLVTTPNKMYLQLPTSKTKLLNVPDVYHYYNYSSGHTALQAIFSYYQFPSSAMKYREDMFISPEDFDQNRFASPQKIVEAAQRKLKAETDPTRQDVFDVSIRDSLTLKQLQQFIDNQIPPILLISGKYSAPNGAYVIAIGYDDEYFYFEDTFRMGSIAYIARTELDRVWKSYEQTEAAQKSASRIAIIINFKDSQRKRQIVPLVRPCP